jgi:hypothetical protein
MFLTVYYLLITLWYGRTKQPVRTVPLRARQVLERPAELNYISFSTILGVKYENGDNRSL